MGFLQKSQGLNTTRIRGFTLIEAFITVAIIGIIASVGWSYYEKELKANRRRDAVAALSTISQVLQQCKTDTGDYSKCTIVQTAPSAGNTKNTGYTCGLYSYNTAADTTGVTTTVNSPNCLYSVKIDIANPADSYTLTAEKVIKDDPDCKTLTLDNLGRKNSTGNFTDYHRCWGN